MFWKKIYGFRFEYAPWKNVWYIASFSLSGFTLVIKLRNFDFKILWNTLTYFGEKIYGVRFEYVPWKNVWFCFIFIVWVHFSHKIEKFLFQNSLKYFNIFWRKNMWCQIWIWPMEKCLTLLHFHCLGSL